MPLPRPMSRFSIYLPSVASISLRPLATKPLRNLTSISFTAPSRLTNTSSVRLQSRLFSTTQQNRFQPSSFKMVVHDLKEYVNWHREKLQQQQQAAQASTRAQAPKTHKKGVDTISSMGEYKEKVLGAPEGKLVVLDCFATWCGPCKTIAPKIAEWSNEGENENVEFYKIDVDQAPDIASELGVRAMPTLYFFKNGESVTGPVVGANLPAIKNNITQFRA